MTLPFSDADFVGPEDRPKAEWIITMYRWGAVANTTIKDYLDEAAGGVAVAVRCAPKPGQGVIYVVTCPPEANKAHNLSISPDHRTASWSLYTPLLAFDFPRLDDHHKAIFKCRPETHGTTKVLVIDVASYKVQKVKKDEQVAAAEQPPTEETTEEE